MEEDGWVAHNESDYTSLRGPGRTDSGQMGDEHQNSSVAEALLEKSDKNGGLGNGVGGDGQGDSRVLAEMKLQCTLAWPIVLANVLSYLYVLVSVMFVGHLGELELASVSIANSFAMVSGYSVTIGLSSAMETLCGQAFGAQRYHLLGVYLQSSLIVEISACIPILVLWGNTEKILLAMGQDPEISRLAASYLRYMMPSLLCCAFVQPLVRFLQTQSIVIPVMVNALVTAIFHPFLCYLLIYVLGFGYHGGALATMISFWILFLLDLGYAIFSGKCARCWNGLAIREALGSVRMYLSLALPSMVMMCFEFWSFELLVLSSGLLPNPSLELSLLTISLNTVTVSDMVPLGLCVAASVRVSNELGANQPNAAELATKVAVGIAIFWGCVIGTALMLTRNLWVHAFTDVREVVDYVSEVMPFIAVITFADSVQAILSGVVRGCGRQALGAIINLVAYYVIGLPVCLCLGFWLHYNGTGLVIGLAVASFMQMIFILISVLLTDWRKMADQAVARVEEGSALQEPLLPSCSKGSS